jgi:hypothetical protein
MASKALTFRQLDINKYLVRFADNVDVHTPDMIAWELKQDKFASMVSFVETRKLEELSGPRIEMEIHLKSTIADVAHLIQQAAQTAADGIRKLEMAFSAQINRSL